MWIFLLVTFLLSILQSIIAFWLTQKRSTIIQRINDPNEKFQFRRNSFPWNDYILGIISGLASLLLNMSDLERGIAIFLFYLACDLQLYKILNDEECFLEFIRKVNNLIFQEEEMINIPLEERQE